MILFRHIKQFPSQFASRQKSLPSVGFDNISIERRQKNITFTGTTQKSGYQTQVEVQLVHGRISSQSPIKMRCSCESFQYEFMFPASKQDGLIGSLPQLPIGKRKPKVKNMYSVISGCKHIVKLAQFIQKQQSKY